MKTLEYDKLAVDHTLRLGLIVLQSDVTIEDEFRYFYQGLPISLLANRIPFENEVTVETLKQMQAHIISSMSLFPLDTQFDCLGYGCTSGALHIGHQAIAQLVDSARPCAATSNPMLAAIAAMHHIKAKKIAYLAPYSVDVSQTMVDEFEKNNIEVVTAATFNESQDRNVGLISPKSTKRACLKLINDAAVDAVFISCTNVKSAHIIPQIEEATGVVAMSSNQVLAWHMLRLANYQEPVANRGSLFAS
ncbi:MAG: maleate isomerase [Arenicella sp.]|jgi:maleate isomerase